jgi:hypothetical protein
VQVYDITSRAAGLLTMAMLLPKGLVGNTAEIYAEVASYPVVPPEKIWQYWNGIWNTTPTGLDRALD